jgi:hypothetical protein
MFSNFPGKLLKVDFLGPFRFGRDSEEDKLSLELPNNIGVGHSLETLDVGDDSIDLDVEDDSIDLDVEDDSLSPTGPVITSVISNPPGIDLTVEADGEAEPPKLLELPC